MSNFTNNFFVFLCDSYDILATTRKYRSIGSWESALDDMRHKEMFDKLKAKKALRNLRKKKWIEDRKKGDEVEFKLTEKGKRWLFQLKIQKEENELPFGQYCIVVFDFPIGANGARDKFRFLLKRIGFSRLQDSVWTTDKDVVDLMQSLVTKLKINKWVRIIIGQEAAALLK